MEAKQATVETKKQPAHELFPLLRRAAIFAEATAQDLECLGEVEVVHGEAGATLFARGHGEPSFWLLVEGEVQIIKPELDGGHELLAKFREGESFGEVPLLGGASIQTASAQVIRDSILIRIESDSFWRLMAGCPLIRAGVLRNMSRRMELYRSLTLHREKLVSLGTLAAGLMHELNNPGAAARRATAQLRENLTRLQQISLRFTRAPLTPEQKDCLRELQEQALALKKPVAMGSLEQADAEERLSEWLESIGIENAWKLAPTLVAIGWSCDDIECAQHAFPPELLSDALNWLESLLSSLQMLGTIEESITRVTDLVAAVKKYAYDDKNAEREIDIHESIQSTLTILSHKFRAKQLTVEKDFAPSLRRIKTCGAGLNQVWTNILDNAIDASPDGGRITIRTRDEGQALVISIVDEGAGISPENITQIFDPFFTTKPAGVGTGLGLDIANRIVTGQYRGQIGATSRPGHTEFVVRIPTTPGGA